MHKLLIFFVVCRFFAEILCYSSGMNALPANGGVTNDLSIEPAIIKARPQRTSTKVSTTSTTTTTTRLPPSHLMPDNSEQTMSLDEYQFMVSLQYKNGNHFCGGSLISRRHILTAAHCVKGSDRQMIPTRDMKVVLGLHNLRDASSINLFSVGRIAVHPNYFMYNGEITDDIAVLTLAKSIPDSLAAKLSRISLPVSEATSVKPGFDVTALGWDLAQNESSSLLRTPLDNLKSATLLTLSPAECARRSGKNPFPVTQICTDSSKKGLCQGDGGSPLFRALPSGLLQLEGIKSYSLGQRCVKPGSANYFTRVSKYLSWFEIAMDNDIQLLGHFN